jgi:hypothetical protein
MREIRTWGSVRGVPSDWHPYRDQRRDAARAPTQRPECGNARSVAGRLQSPQTDQPFWRESGKSQGFGDRVPK